MGRVRAVKAAAWAERLAALVTGRLASWLGVGFWVVVVAASAPFAAKLGSVESSRLSELLPAGAPSTEAARLDARFPSGRALPAEIVFFSRSGLRPVDLALAREELARARSKLGRTSGPASPLTLSANGKAAVAVVGVPGNEDQVQRSIKALRSALAGGAPGLEVQVTGQAAVEADLLATFSGADEKLLVATALLVAFLLAATYRSPLLWLVPLATIALAEAVARAVMYGLARGGLAVNVDSASLVTVVVFGAGTDYALLLTARYREELQRQDDHRLAMRTAWRRVAPVVAASSLTVAVTLASLLLAHETLVSGFGVVGEVGVLSAGVVVLAAYPSLLLVLGKGIFWPMVPRRAAGAVQHGMWARVARFVSRGTRPVWVSALVLLGGAAAGLVSANTNVSALSELPPSAPSVRGYNLLASSFPPGEVFPVDVVMTNAARLGTLRRALRDLKVTASLGPVERSGSMARFDLVLAVSPNGPHAWGTIRTLRSVASEVAPGQVLVGGQTAEDLDSAAASHHDIFVVVPLVLAVVLLVLCLVLRALLGPVLVVAAMVVTFGAALGVTSAVFVPLLHLPGIDPAVPLLGFVFLMALGADYSIFLLTRMREDVLALGARDGVRAAVASTGPVLTSAGVVLAGTFAVLAVLPVVASREIGIAVALGVLADTVLVRTVVLPQLATELGRWFWLPTRVPGTLSAQAGRPSP